MHRILAVLVAIAGLVGFASAGYAACAGHLDMADTSSTTVATDDGSTTPILPDQSGG